DLTLIACSAIFLNTIIKMMRHKTVKKMRNQKNADDPSNSKFSTVSTQLNIDYAEMESKARENTNAFIFDHLITANKNLESIVIALSGFCKCESISTGNI
ncbi:MAG: hypothetical protein MHPSP_003570, partial [Paramarteilia canceri]